MGPLEIDSDYEGYESELRDAVHEVARDVVRPAGLEIDRMSHDEVRSLDETGSVYRKAIEAMEEVVPRSSFLPEEFGGDGMTGREFHVVMEEFGWGSSGLAMAFSVDIMPPLFATMSFNDDLIESYVEPYLSGDLDHQGCWGLTEPQHGSETLQAETLLMEGEDNIPSPQVTAEKDGDEWIINGAKAPWVSAGPLATHCALHVNLDASEGSHGALAVVPLDANGVERGAAIDKMGQRDCPQGDLSFDGVRIPDRNVVLGPDALHPDTGYVSLDQILCVTSCGVAAVSTGLARAAFEEALEYAREREQGGKPIARHQTVKKKLYDMFEKVETARAYSRRACEHVWDRTLESFEFDASHRHAVAAQVYCKRTAFEVAHDAVQIHGGNGITRDYPVEKMFRDARVKLIEDGTLDVLSLESAEGVIEGYKID
jgi:alkylation response protein AidB-like acyl-CoA dehydrogenase